jgi:hypothetical protein
MAASFVEYFVELWLFPGLKTFSPVIYLGLLGAIFGQGKPLSPPKEALLPPPPQLSFSSSSSCSFL